MLFYFLAEAQAQRTATKCSSRSEGGFQCVRGASRTRYVSDAKAAGGMDCSSRAVERESLGPTDGLVVWVPSSEFRVQTRRLVPEVADRWFKWQVGLFCVEGATKRTG